MYLPDGGGKHQWLSYLLIGGFLFVIGFFYLLNLVDSGHIRWDIGQLILDTIK